MINLLAIKTLSKLRAEGTFLNSVKDISEVNMMFNDQLLECFPVKFMNKTGCLLFLLLITIKV